jgi:excisionase family DNA binding protein
MPQTLLPPSAGRPAGSPWPVPAAATYLSVSVRHLWRLIDAGRVRAIRIGRRVLVPDSEVRRVAAEGI